MFNIFKLFSKDKASHNSEESVRSYAVGQDAAASIMKDIDEFFDNRVATLAKEYISVFRDRLTTINDEKSHTPEVVAGIELKIFIDCLEEAMPRLKAEAHSSIARWNDVVKELMAEEPTEQYISMKISNAYEEITDIAAKMTAEAVEQSGRST